MGQSQCPFCYSPLEVREVTPCYVCGGWAESVARFDPAAAFTEFRLPGGQTFVLCRRCELEEFMVPGGWGYRLAPGEKLPFKAMQQVRAVDMPQLGRDKFCPSCNLRLAFVKVVMETESKATESAPMAEERDWRSEPVAALALSVRVQRCVESNEPPPSASCAT
jgi:hypothetical protein